MRMQWTVVFALLAVVGCGSKKDPGTGGNGSDDMGVPCGNGVVDPMEDCDEGMNNGAVGGRCNVYCQWNCAVDANCDDSMVCNGAETCVDHACKPGTVASDGTACGTGKVCNAGNCIASRCGDGMVDSGEECDDGNAANGDGCQSNCKFTCKSSDTTRNCTPADSCAGQGTCNDTTHVCAPGTPLADGTSCPGGANNYCKGGVCKTPVCGNGTIEKGETCDDAGLNGTTSSGCKTDCTYVCVNPTADCGAPQSCNKFSCTAKHTCEQVPDPSKDGMSCPGGATYVCKNGACAPPGSTCGNGVVEAGEDCDFGAGNGHNTGCEANTCKYSCASATNCADGNDCNGAETCDPVTVGSSTGKKCNPGTALNDGTPCGTGMDKICLTKICQISVCGDGVIDPRDPRHETCEPPSTATCDSVCHEIKCGDGIRNGPEQCDDSNRKNLDGCDSDCKFEQLQRANSLSMEFVTTAMCTKNRLGSAFPLGLFGGPGIAGGIINTNLSDGIKAGTIDIIIKFLGLKDLTGASASNFALGFLNGAPVTGGTYDGTNDVDWWYTIDGMSIDPSRNPVTTMSNAKFVSSHLTADPATLTLHVILAGSQATLTMYDSRMTATAGASDNPMMSGGTPGHLTSENLDPGLTSFRTASAGEMCGNISASSLYAVSVPTMLQGTLCNNAFMGTNHHLLDVIVEGCTGTLGQLIKPIQPDGSTDGQPYTLTLTNHEVTGCTGGAPFPMCLDKATYSSAFLFTADRVIPKE